MLLLVITSLITSFLFAIFTLYLSSKEEKLKKELENPQSLYNKRKDDFMHMLIHELRAPLTAIKGAAELILSPEKKLDTIETIKMAKLIDEQAKKLLEQVGSLLDLAKIQAAQFSVQKTPIDLVKLIRDETAVFVPQANTKNINLTTSLEEGLPVVLADKLRVNQVINNLLSNSLKFTKEGGTITVSAKKSDSKYIVISVTDTGMGIENEKQKGLFTKFYQAASATQPGSGLGLYIVKHIVEAHGGTISLASEVGRGTTITFTIPL